mgnify:CR=1 FL=1
MALIKKSQYSDLIKFAEFDSQDHVEEFFSYKSLQVHQKDFLSEDIAYLSIVDVFGGVVGYFILQLAIDEKTVQFKRILVDDEHLGIGQDAISSMESYCKIFFGTNRIWLDVYKENRKAKHIYEKLGYIKFKEVTDFNKTILFYEKHL